MPDNVYSNLHDFTLINNCLALRNPKHSGVIRALNNCLE
jgi:hypothetical protein